MLGALDDEMRELAKETTNHELLNSLSNGSASLERWAIYIRERLRTIDPEEGPEEDSIFEQLLEAAIECARSQKYSHLVGAFESNLKDEKGVRRGEVNSEEVHALWRKRFRAAILSSLESRGIPKETFSQAPNPATLAYNALIRELISEFRAERLFESAGALCALEGIIRDEYKKVGLGLNFSFSGLCTSDRRYIDDHARHDEGHYVSIQRALAQILESQDEPGRAEILTAIQRGASRIAKAKQDFFEGVLMA